MKNQKKPLVYVIILNWNGKNLLDDCLQSVLKTRYSSLKIVVVDNGSTDGSQNLVHKFGKIELVENQKNLGFAGGNNVGIKYALENGAKYIVLLNTDVIVDEEWISTAVNFAENDKKIGIVGFKLFGSEKPVDIKEFYNYKKIKTKTAEELINGYVCGCAIFVTRKLVERIGFLDPVYFLFEDEIDWGKRAKKIGFKEIVVDVPVYHKLAATTKRVFLKSSFLQIRNTIRCSIKNDSLFQILRRFMAVINTACNPFKRVDKMNVIFIRLRPYNILLNLIIVVNAFAWNTLFLPQTLYSRHKRFQNPKKYGYISLTKELNR